MRNERCLHVFNIILTFAPSFHNTSPFAGFRIRPHGIYPVFSTFNLPHNHQRTSLRLSITFAQRGCTLLPKGVIPFCPKGSYPFAQRGRTLLPKGGIPFCLSASPTPSKRRSFALALPAGGINAHKTRHGLLLSCALARESFVNLPNGSIMLILITRGFGIRTSIYPSR